MPAQGVLWGKQEPVQLSEQAARRQVRARLEAAAREQGFWGCGLARAEVLTDERARWAQWLAEGRHGELHYLADADARTNPAHLLPGCRTVAVFAHDYLPPGANAQGPLQPPQTSSGRAPKIARYAWGADYHHVLKRRLAVVAEAVQAEATALGLPPVRTRACVDSAPIDERAWARRAGLGWVGKHTLLIHPQRGSYFFLAVLLLDLELPIDAAVVTDHCGTCTRCLDACPTQALTPYRLDARRCLSYQTIEIKGAVAPEHRAQSEGWAFGCDICQEMCPWNRFAAATAEPDFTPREHVALTAEQWRDLTPSQHKKLTRPTAMSRIRRAKWLDNLAAAGYLADDESAG